MHYNNRMPVYRQKKLTPLEITHREVKDGKSIFVKGPKKNPYKNVDYESLKLKSRIDTGVFVNHEGSPRPLEKASGSDIMTAEIEKRQREYEDAQHEASIKNERAKLRKIVADYNPEVAELIKD